MVCGMTSQEYVFDAGAPAPARVNCWNNEFIETIRLAAPMALTQLGQIAMMSCDLALLGRLGGKIVAATALAHSILFTAFVLGTGVVTAVAPLTAQAYGAGQPRMVRRALRVGLWAALLLGAPLTAAQFWAKDLLLLLGQEPDTVALAGRYLAGLALSLMPAWAFIALRNFMGSLNRPEPALWITLGAIPANFLLAYAFIYGAFGLPQLDILGAGVATTLVNLGMCGVAIWTVYACHPFKKYHALGYFWRLDWPHFRKLLAVGLPISGAYLLEVGLFTASALLMGHIGKTALAAHQIAIQIAAILFMVPFGIAQAATVRVGQAAGRGDAIGARRAGFAALGLGAGFMAVMALLVVLTHDMIPLVFLGPQTPDFAARELASALLLVGASFFVADGVQTVAAGALRGSNDTRVPLLFAAVSFWFIGFPSGYTLAFHTYQGAIGIWTGLSLGLVVYAVLLVWRFHALTKPRAP
jgi:MATE family multidrug resistance protein